MIFVTGASGFIGRSLVRALAREGRPVTAYTGRINNPMTLRVEMEGATTVIHLTGAEARGRPRLLQHVDVDGTARLLEESRRAGVQHLILVSRLGADPHAIHPLPQAKGEVERLVRRSGLPFTILRSATLFGKEDRFLNVIAGLAVWTWPLVWLPAGGHTPMQPLWVEDLVRCLVQCLDRPGLRKQIIELAGEERLHYVDLVRCVLETAGLQRTLFKIDVRLARPIARAMMGWWRRPPVSRFWLDRLSAPEVAPVDAVLHHFGFRPGRVTQHMAYLRQPGLHRAIFRL